MTEIAIEAATAMARGDRDRQEDAVLADFPAGGPLGLAILSDGMGGHADGDMASRLIVTEMFGELFYRGARPDTLRADLPGALRRGLQVANDSLRSHVEAGTGQQGMGGTLITAVVSEAALHWLSVGDSLLYILRGRTLHRLNEDHSMAPQIDLMVRHGVLDAQQARAHPQRGMLTSALTGAAVEKVDCPDSAVTLAPGDVVLLASDGVAVLGERRLRRLLIRHRRAAPARIARALIAAVEAAGEPDQDNTSVVVVKAARAPGAARALPPPLPLTAPVAAAQRGLSGLIGERLQPLLGRLAP